MSAFSHGRRIEGIAAEAQPLPDEDSHLVAGENLVAVREPWPRQESRNNEFRNNQPSNDDFCSDEDHEYERRTYRERTVAMLRRYMRYAMETGRLPSVLGREFFRAKVTSYTVVTFEDRVIFVHDMETCLDRLDEFSRELIARHVLQEHDRCATARLLHCNEKTVRRLTPLALDQLSEILLDMGLMERLDTERLDATTKILCQGGEKEKIYASD